MALHQASAAAVAVMDFATSAKDATLEWARMGVPDLLGVELAAHGWEVLDRESIEQVMRELSLTDDVQAGHLVGAEYVVSGRVSSPEPGRLLIEATLTKVEGLETVRTISQTGVYPKNLDSLIRALAEELAIAPRAQTVLAQDRAEAWVPKPEALIFFYRGLSAYSAGYPEAAVAWFINAGHMDTRFAAAMAWEIRALTAAGFPDMAQRAAEGYGRRWAGLNKSKDEGTRTLLLARPLLMPAGTWTAEQTRELMSAFSAGLSQRKEVSLINPEALERAIREQDYQLGGFFSGATTARYGRWRIPDGLLQCRIERNGDLGQVQLWIETLSTGGPIVREESRIAMGGLSTVLPGLLDRLLARWEEKQMPMAAPEIRPCLGLIPEMALEGLSENHRDLARALNRLRQTSGFEEWNSVADAFRRIDYGPLGGLAIERVIQHINLDAPDADLALNHMWYELYSSGCRPPPPVQYASPSVLAELETNLLVRFPDSICAGALWYDKGRIAWSAKRLEEAGDYMEKALDVLVPGRSKLEDWTILAALYVQADSLGRQGFAEEALRIFLAAREHIHRHSVAARCLPIGVFIGSDHQIAGFGGEGADLLLLVEDGIRRYASGDPATPTTLDRLAGYATRHTFRTDENLRDFAVPALDTLVEAWKTIGPFKIGNTDDLGLARHWLSLMSRALSESERRAWFPGFIDAYLQRVKLPSAGAFEEIAPIDLLPHSGTLWSFFTTVQLRQEGLAFLDRFLEPAVPTAVAVEVLSQVNLEKEELALRLTELAGRRPGGEREIPGSLWMRLTLLYAEDKDWDAAATAMKKGFVSTRPVTPGDETARVLIHQALERAAEDPYAEVKVACAELGVLPWIPRWWQWYNEGRKATAAGKYGQAIACYRVVLRFLDAPQEMDPTIQLGPAWRGLLRFQQGDDMDYDWTADKVSRRNSAKFRMAVSFLSLKQPDQAAALLREVALEVGQEQADFFNEIHANSSSYKTVHLGVLASTLLHSLHLLDEIQWEGTPVLDRDDVVRQCEAASLELRGMGMREELQLFRSVAKRLKSIKYQPRPSPPLRTTKAQIQD